MNSMWSVPAQHPVIIKRKRKLSKLGKPRTITIHAPHDESLLVGDVPLGRSADRLPTTIDRTKVHFTAANGSDYLNILIEENDGTAMVELLIDAPFIKSLITCSLFNFKWHQEDAAVTLSVYMRQLPLTQTIPAKSIQQTIAVLFKVCHNVGNPVDNAQTAKNVDDMVHVEQLYRRVREAQQHRVKELEARELSTPALCVELRSYQQAAVRWMLEREATGQQITDLDDPCFERVELPARTVWVDVHHGNVQATAPMVPVRTAGGILADEMGLGKTIELLALIVHDLPAGKCSKAKSLYVEDQRPRPHMNIPTMEEETPPARKSLREHLVAHYEAELAKRRTRQRSRIVCICGSFEANVPLCECVDCGRQQHSDCVGFEPTPADHTVYRCAQCWPKAPLIDSKGTLIVCPPTLCQQWLDEIKSHLRADLRVLHYTGGGGNAVPVYPTILAGYDIVVTTYAVLQHEFHYLHQQQCKTTRGGRYSPVGSPMGCVRWRRVCLDEAQLVERTGTRVAEMARRIHAHFRWAVTGTPISVSICDLYGLLDYLHLAPFNDETTFMNVLYKPYLAGTTSPLVDFLARILWRTRKADVLEQINIPAQSTRHHVVQFTEVERYFYDLETRKSQASFTQRLKRFDPHATLISLKHNDLSALLQPVMALRRVCVHHNVVKGRVLLTRKPVQSMQHLLDALIARNLTECEAHLRQTVAARNGLAGAYILLGNASEAARQYLSVQRLATRFGAFDADIALALDKLPVIHMLHNLRELVIMHPHLVEEFQGEGVTLDVQTLAASQERLEAEYLKKFEAQLHASMETLAVAGEKVDTLAASITLVTWYADIAARLFEKGLHARFQKRIDQMLERLRGSAASRLRVALVVERLDAWIADVLAKRDAAMESVQTLYDVEEKLVVFRPGVAQQAVDCHLRPKKGKSKPKTCGLCESHRALIAYERVLFHAKKKGKQIDWAASEEEMVLKCMLRVAKTSLRTATDVAAIECGTAFLEMLDTQKKEFRELRKEWTLLDAQLCSSDELVLCKVRLALKGAEQPAHVRESLAMRQLRQLSYELQNKTETINEIGEHEVDVYRFNLAHEDRLHAARLEKCLGTHKYLRSMHSEDGGRQLDPCPVCRCQLDAAWNMLRCGHAFCIKCMQTLVESEGRGRGRTVVACPLCRQEQHVHDINCVDRQSTDRGMADVKGNYSSKVGRIVRLIQQLRAEDADVKILLFSTWVAVLRVVREILVENGISNALMASGVNQSAVRAFKDPARAITVLLLPVSFGAKGLNLVEATQVIFAEPLLDPAEEAQAIGRIHRIGQFRETVVHKFTMTDSIETEIRRVTSEEESNWDRNKVTVQQIKDLLFAEGSANDDDALAMAMDGEEEEEESDEMPIESTDMDSQEDDDEELVEMDEDEEGNEDDEGDSSDDEPLAAKRLCASEDVSRACVGVVASPTVNSEEDAWLGAPYATLSDVDVTARIRTASTGSTTVSASSGSSGGSCDEDEDATRPVLRRRFHKRLKRRITVDRAIDAVLGSQHDEDEARTERACRSDWHAYQWNRRYRKLLRKRMQRRTTVDSEEEAASPAGTIILSDADDEVPLSEELVLMLDCMKLLQNNNKTPLCVVRPRANTVFVLVETGASRTRSLRLLHDGELVVSDEPRFLAGVADLDRLAPDDSSSDSDVDVVTVDSNPVENLIPPQVCPRKSLRLKEKRQKRLPTIPKEKPSDEDRDKEESSRKSVRLKRRVKNRQQGEKLKENDEEVEQVEWSKAAKTTPSYNMFVASQQYTPWRKSRYFENDVTTANAWLSDDEDDDDDDLQDLLLQTHTLWQLRVSLQDFPY